MAASGRRAQGIPLNEEIHGRRNIGTHTRARGAQAFSFAPGPQFGPARRLVLGTTGSALVGIQEVAPYLTLQRQLSAFRHRTRLQVSASLPRTAPHDSGPR